ncbi:MAG: hypothetical protein RLW62_15045 [Gammaproteobacteria bacterium]
MNALKKTVAAVAVAATGALALPAHAAIDFDDLPLGSKFTDSAAGGELFLSVVARGDAPAENRSLVVDLGLLASDFVALGTGSLSITPVAELSSFLAAQSGKAISFNVTAVHNPGGFDPVTFDTLNTGFLSTSREDAASTAAKAPQSVSAAAIKANPTLQSFVQGVNLATDGSPSGNTALNLAATFAPGEFGFHDNNFGGDSTFGFNTEGQIGGMVDFYFLKLSNFNPFELVELGTFSLLGDGTLEFQPVPVPAAAWLLGSALVAGAGAVRRRKV